MGLFFMILTVVFSVFYVYTAFHKLEQWERVAIFSRFSRKYRYRKGPGLFVFVEPIFSFARGPVSIKDWQIKVPFKGITKDNVEIDGESFVVLRVADTNEVFGKLFTEVENPKQASEQAAQAVLSFVIGENDLNDFIRSPREVGQKLIIQLKEIVEKWGIEVRDFRMSQPNILNSEVEVALGLAAAQLVRAKAQEEVAKLFEEAAVHYENPCTRWLKDKEVLLEAVHGPNNVIIVPQNFGGSEMGALALSLATKKDPDIGTAADIAKNKFEEINRALPAR